MEIRSWQIAPCFVGSTVNSPVNHADGVHVYVKSVPQMEIPNRCYCDIIDNDKILGWLRNNSSVSVIVISKSATKCVSEYCDASRVFLIPQQHCNAENKRIPDRPVETVGFIGSVPSCRVSLTDIRTSLALVGLRFLYYLTPRKLRRVVEFYLGIDIQIIYRPWESSEATRVRLKDGLKVFNAGSFGIPTVSTPGPEFEEECSDAYLRANSFEELILQCRRLKENRNLYQETAGRAMEVSKLHHISRILPLYKQILEYVE